jgi:hypothetical protein
MLMMNIYRLLGIRQGGGGVADENSSTDTKGKWQAMSIG